MVALGLVPHTGWTWLVRVRDGVVEARERVVAVDVLDGELYHQARDHAGDRERFFAARRAEMLAKTLAAMRAYGDASAAIVLGKQQPAEPLAKIVASHAKIHGGEGELWRALFAEALASCGVQTMRAEATDVRASLGKRGVDTWLAAAGKALGSPWTAEIKDAACAARYAAISSRKPRA
jgi:hypothetical protein